MRLITLRAICLALLNILAATGQAAPVADIASTKHNLSTSGPGPVKATSEDQICVFCHTPHQAEAIPNAPLWNRQQSSATYTPYTSSSMDAVGLGQPGGSAKLCLSCHDGTMALGAVNVLEGQTGVTVALDGTTAGKMPAGSGELTGYTRNLGVDLTNDHPISFDYDSTLADADKELYDPALVGHIASRVPGAPRPVVPLEDGQVGCVSCHDPHIRDSDLAKNIKFLRLNRFQEVDPIPGSFDQASDQICLACHDKDGWTGSAHAHPQVADEVYTSTAALQRDLPSGLPVWQAACLNCHDTHTVQGARRLLREGTDSVTVPKNGGNAALEETCYQCHDGGSGAVLTNYTNVPNIKSEFALATRMPITGIDQPAGSEVHDIGSGSAAQPRGADFVEDPLLLGKGNPLNRHAECTDCHNPHRMIRKQQFNADPAAPDAVGSHEHTHTAMHSNIISGVLSGTSGVEPSYGSAAWGSAPSGYTLKRGYGGPGSSSDVNSPYVTREYQICLKCHSDYAFDTPPLLGDSGGGTLAGTNGMLQFTDQAMEFQAPLADKGETTALHRSWHPVIDNTGRTAAVRGAMAATNFLDPWNDSSGTNIGNQTMYCSDCHGSNTTGIGTVNGVAVLGTGTSTPDAGKPWGPHGSSNSFILKGNWLTTGTAATLAGPPDARDICFKCHDKNAYSPAVPPATYPKSGFSCVACTGAGGGGGGGGGGAGCAMSQNANSNLHIGHVELLGELRCTWCHTAVPHGWGNKALLVDITNDAPVTTGNTCAGVEPCNAAPYYQNAYLGGNGPGTNTLGGAGVSWATSGNWLTTDCGGSTGAWMAQVCNNPL